MSENIARFSLERLVLGLLIIFFTAVALLSTPMKAGNAAEGKKTEAQKTGFSQKWLIKISKAEIAKEEAGPWDGGQAMLQVRSLDKEGNVIDSWSSKEAGIPASGPSLAIDTKRLLVIEATGKLVVRLLDEDLVKDDLISEWIIAGASVRTGLGGRLVKKGGKSWVEMFVVDIPGRYHAELRRTLVDREDFLAIGGTLSQDPPPSCMDKNPQDWMLAPKETFKDCVNDFKTRFLEALEPCNHRVVVKCFDKTIFDTQDLARDDNTGLLVDWGASFTFDWKPGDRLQVTFEDHDATNKDDVIFSKSRDGKASIGLLQGVITGGAHDGSAVYITAEPLDFSSK